MQQRTAGLSYTHAQPMAPSVHRWEAPMAQTSMHQACTHALHCTVCRRKEGLEVHPSTHHPCVRTRGSGSCLSPSLLNHTANAGRASPRFPQRRGAGSRGRSERAFAAPRFVASASCTLSLSGGACACAQGSSLRSGLWVLVVLSAGTLIRFVSPLGRRPALGVPHPGGRHPRSRFTPRCVLSCLCSASISLSERVFCRETAAA